jgi:branched-chain amino acid transport system substrate-binding protein
VAVFHHDSPFGTSPLEAGRDYINERHLDIGYKTYAMPVGATDYLAQLDAARRQGVRFVIVHNVAARTGRSGGRSARGG